MTSLLGSIPKPEAGENMECSFSLPDSSEAISWNCRLMLTCACQAERPLYSVYFHALASERKGKKTELRDLFSGLFQNQSSRSDQKRGAGQTLLAGRDINLA